MTRTELQELSKLRLHEAQLLLAGHGPSGAYYLAGYAVECALKACIAKATVAESFPDKQRANQVHTHSLHSLLQLAQLSKMQEEYAKANVTFATYWSIAAKWSEASRYTLTDHIDAQNLLDAVSDVSDGVLRWLSLHW